MYFCLDRFVIIIVIYSGYLFINFELFINQMNSTTKTSRRIAIVRFFAILLLIQNSYSHLQKLISRIYLFDFFDINKCYSRPH